jgi:hypothetical protein
VAVPVISSSVMQISTSSCPATRMQRLSRVFQSCRVRRGRRVQLGMDGQVDQRRKAAKMLERGRGQRAAATRSRCCFERWSWSCSGVGGPRSGCNSSKEGAWPDAGLVGVGPWLLYCSLLLVSLDLFGPGGPLGPPLGPLGRPLRSCSVVPPLCGIPASVSEPLACALDRHWLAEAFDVWSLSASFNHTSLLGPGLALGSERERHCPPSWQRAPVSPSRNVS